MKKLCLLATVAMFGLTACSSVNMGVPAGALKETVRADHIANVRVGEKISGESSAKVLFGFFTLSEDNKYADGVNYAGETSMAGIALPSLDGKLRSAAAYKAVTSSGADVIVAPTYTTYVEKDYIVYKEVRSVVKGYKGTITGFTQIK